MLGVTRVVLELVILRHCHDRLPDDSMAGNLSRVVEVSLFKREHSQTQKRPTTQNPAASDKESLDGGPSGLESIAVYVVEGAAA
jgi:hypothetical protein